MGLYSAVTYAAMSLGIAGFRPIFETYGFAAAILSAVCVMLALILAALARRRSRSDSEAAG